MLYAAMDVPNSVTYFVRLLHFADRVLSGLVLLAEAACCCLFGTLSTDLYRRIRPHGLPVVDFTRGLNKSDPISLSFTGGARFAEAKAKFAEQAVTLQRLKRLENCLHGGPMPVYYSEKRGGYRLGLFALEFTIPIEVGFAWELYQGGTVDAKFEALSARHPRPYAPMASDQDPGKGIGICISKMIDGERRVYWLQRDRERVPKRSISTANTLYDFLTGSIVGRNYDWDNHRSYSRVYMFRNGYTKNIISSSSTTKRSKSLPIAVNEIKFKWNDPNRLPETKPRTHIKDIPSHSCSNNKVKIH